MSIGYYIKGTNIYKRKACGPHGRWYFWSFSASDWKQIGTSGIKLDQWRKQGIVKRLSGSPVGLTFKGANLDGVILKYYTVKSDEIYPESCFAKNKKHAKQLVVEKLASQGDPVLDLDALIIKEIK